LFFEEKDVENIPICPYCHDGGNFPRVELVEVRPGEKWWSCETCRKKWVEKTECAKSPTGDHEWKTVEPQQLPDGREDWSVVPGNYCTFCGKKEE
jgi:hypothetical protein